MPFYRCGMGQATGGYTQEDIDSFFIESEGVKYYQGNALFRSDDTINAPINIGANVSVASYMLDNAQNFNSPITFMGNVKCNCDWMLNNCNNFNQPVIWGSNKSLISALKNSQLFNSQVSIGENCYLMMTFENCKGFNRPLPNIINPLYMAQMIRYTNYNYPINVFNANNIVVTGMLTDDKAFNQNVNFINCNTIVASMMLSGCSNFNAYVNTGNAEVMAQRLYQACSDFDKPVNAERFYNANGAFFQSSKFNQPLNVGTLVTRDIGINCNCMLDKCYAFNSDITFGEKVNDIGKALQNCNTFAGNIFIKGNTSRELIATKLFVNTSNDLRKNVYFNSVFNGVFNVNGQDPNVITTGPVEWTPMTNGFYNTVFNVYCYYNYAG